MKCGNMRRFGMRLAGILLTVGLSGCSVFVPHSQTLSVVASEPDAMIFINGKPAGMGMASAKVPRNKSATILATKPGFRPAEKTVRYQLSGAGLADIIGGVVCLVPAVGLLTPGAQRLSEESVSIVLQPADGSTTSLDGTRGTPADSGPGAYSPPATAPAPAPLPLPVDVPSSY